MITGPYDFKPGQRVTVYDPKRQRQAWILLCVLFSLCAVWMLLNAAAHLSIGDYYFGGRHVLIRYSGVGLGLLAVVAAVPIYLRNRWGLILGILCLGIKTTFSLIGIFWTLAGPLGLDDSDKIGIIGFLFFGVPLLILTRPLVCGLFGVPRRTALLILGAAAILGALLFSAVLGVTSLPGSMRY